MTEIHAPYNFVPLADWVYFPDWSRQASHDVPFSDGLSGTLPFTVKACGPLLVAAEQEGSDKTFMKAPDGRYFIPGSSLRGLIRNVLEIATFGKMVLADERRLGVRDLSGGLPAYTGEMTDPDGCTYTPKTKAGWLRFVGGRWEMTPCEHSRVEYTDLVSKLLREGSGRIAYKTFMESRLDDVHRTARAKYEKWKECGGCLDVAFDPQPLDDHRHSDDNKGHPRYLRYSKALNPGTGETPGRLVLTGQPSPVEAGKSGRKHMEFIFHSPATEAIPVPPDIMQGFRQVHAESKDWKEWRKLHLRNPEEAIPIFYLESDSGGISSLGLAQMFRLPYQLSIRGALRNSSEDHDAQTPDFVETLFGSGAGEAEGLKGRVSFGHAFCRVPNPEPGQTRTVILNGPKSSYYPSYIRQPTDMRGTRLADGSHYVTLMNPNARLRGWKRYPAKPFAEPPNNIPPSDVTATLHPLAKNTIFNGNLRFHNLCPEELGGLLWALNFGDRPDRVHGLGMGKPFGYGQISITVDEFATVLRCNCPSAESVPEILKRCRAAFITLMDRVYREKSGRWEDSPQITALLAMADPEEGRDRRLDYMVLDHQSGLNEFADAKKKGKRLVLPEYEKIPRAGPSASLNAGLPSWPRRPDALKALEAEVMANDPGVGRTSDALRSEALAVAWTRLPEGEEKAAVKAWILGFWKVMGWRDEPPDRDALQAKAIYERGRP